MISINTKDLLSKGFNIDVDGSWNYKGKTMIIQFSATWCQPCVVISEILNEFENKYPNINFYKVDCEDEYELTKLFTVKNLPTLVFMSSDGTYKQISGVIGAAKIENLLLELIENKVTTI